MGPLEYKKLIARSVFYMSTEAPFHFPAIFAVYCQLMSGRSRKRERKKFYCQGTGHGAWSDLGLQQDGRRTRLKDRHAPVRRTRTGVFVHVLNWAYLARSAAE